MRVYCIDMKPIFVGLLSILLLPSFAYAAGFAKQTIFLSKDSVTEGDVVLVHAIVSNEASATFVGKLEIVEKGSSIGTVPVSLKTGEASVVSVSWKPAAGSHTLTAQLMDSANTVIEKESGTFAVAAKPKTDEIVLPAKPTQTELIQSSADIQQKIAEFSPQAASTTAPMFSTIDSVRAQAAQTLDKGVSWSKKQIGQSGANNSGVILGAEIEKTLPQKATSTLWMIFATLALYVLSIGRYIISTPGAFYPIFALLFLYILWRLFRRFRRR